MNEKPKILIADDSEINRALLKEILGDGYDYLEAEDGAAAVELMRQRTDISLLLLDLMMPGMDGFDVLRVMKYHAWLDEIPVIVISAAEDTANIERAYDLGVTDYIRRPFERIMVLRRVKNILMLYAKQKRLTRLVTDQVYEKEHNSVLMISILSHVVEFRNSESGLHVLHIRTLTDLLLHRLVQKTDRYQLDESDIALISTASALHDIGKIVIPEEILNKPGRLTAEEFAIIKNHTVAGAQMLQDLGRAIALASSEDFNLMRQEVLHLLKHVKDADISELLDYIRKLKEDNLDIYECLDFMQLWYRDVLLYKVTKDINLLVFKDEYRSINEISQVSGYDGLEQILDAIDKARVRLDANVNMDLAMELMLLVMKEN